MANAVIKAGSCRYGFTAEAYQTYFVEKMADGTWTAYQSSAYDDEHCRIWLWQSPKHRTRRSAVDAVHCTIRQIRKGLKQACAV